MIDDPDDEDFRCPVPGERYWHRPWDRWVVISGEEWAVSDEVAVVFEDTGQHGTVKLKSLEEEL